MEDECDGLGSGVCSGADRPKTKYCIDTIGKLVVIVVRCAVDKFMDEATGSGLQEREGEGERVPLFREMAKGSMTDPLCVAISSNT